MCQRPYASGREAEVLAYAPFDGRWVDEGRVSFSVHQANVSRARRSSSSISASPARVAFGSAVRCPELFGRTLGGVRVRVVAFPVVGRAAVLGGNGEASPGLGREGGRGREGGDDERANGCQGAGAVASVLRAVGGYEDVRRRP